MSNHGDLALNSFEYLTIMVHFPIDAICGVLELEGLDILIAAVISASNLDRPHQPLLDEAHLQPLVVILVFGAP